MSHNGFPFYSNLQHLLSHPHFLKMYVGDKMEANTRRGHSSTYLYKLFIASKYAFPGFLKKILHVLELCFLPISLEVENG